MMNEHIVELAKQAGFVTWSDEEWKPKGAVIDWANDYDKELEKFAKLIVKECMEQVRGQYLPVMEDKEMMKDTRWDGYVQCGVDSVVAIREHFGVEE